MSRNRPAGQSSPRRLSKALSLAVLVAVSVACGGGGGGGGGSSPTAPPAPPPMSSSTFSQLQSNIFTPSCATAGCHDAATAAQGLVLSAGPSYGNIVGVLSTQMPGLNLIEPGDPDLSYLIRKVRGEAGITGVRMPAAGPALSAQQIADLEQWVSDGAPNN